MRKVIFVSHCILNQNARPGAPENINQLLRLFSDSNIGIIQLPCPEIEFNGGLKRQSISKQHTENYRKKCNDLSIEILQCIKKYIKSDYEVLGILGIEFSSTCGIHQTRNIKKIIPGKGTLMKQIEKELQKEDFQIPFIGIDPNKIDFGIKKLEKNIGGA